MNDFQYAGRTMSIVVGFCVYILIWRYALNIYDANYDYGGLSQEKVIKLFCCIWVYGTFRVWFDCMVCMELDVKI